MAAAPAARPAAPAAAGICRCGKCLQHQADTRHVTPRVNLVEEACDRKADRVGCNQAPALQGVGQMPTDLGQHREAIGIRMAIVEVGQSGYQVSAQGADRVLRQVASQILQSR